MNLKSRQQPLLLKLERLERREMLTAEFLGHFDNSPGVWEVGEMTIHATSSGASSDDDAIWRLDESGMDQLTQEQFNHISKRRQDSILVGNQLFFFPTSGGDEEVWVTDGTEDGTRRVFTPPPAANVRAYNSIGFENKLFFPQRDELWTSDGTPEGTYLVVDTDPSRRPCMKYGCRISVRDPDIEGLTEFQDSIFFTVWKSSQTELWKSDGTAEGTHVVTTINGEADDRDRRLPWQLSVQDEHHLLLANNQGGRWLSDGTAEGTVQLPDVDRTKVHDAIPVGQTDFLLDGNAEDSYELWVETGSGRQLLKSDIIVHSRCSVEFQHATIGESLFFPARDENGNPGLWKSDGTIEGTELVKDTLLIPALVAGHHLVLWGSDDESGTELWKTDGTTEGTIRMTDSPEGSFNKDIVGRFYSKLYASQDYLYFTTGTPTILAFGMTGGNGMDLWKIPLSGRAHGPSSEVIDSLYAAIESETYESRFDLVKDDELNESDVQFLIENTLQTQFGDTNLDGIVNFTDFVQLSSNFGLENSSWSQGDFDGDGQTGFEDFLLLSNNYGFGQGNAP